MSAEIKVVASLSCTKGNFTLPANSKQVSADQSGTGGGVPGSVTATTGGVDIDATGVAALGWARLQNLDVTNWVEFGVKVGGTFYPVARLLPGEPVLLRLTSGNTGTYHLKANVASCIVQVQILAA